MKTQYFSMISIFAIVTMGITVELPHASSDSGSLTELYTPSPDLTKMSLSLYDTFQQTSSNSTKNLHLEFFDAKNNTMIKNVSFFINVTKGDKILIHDLFYTKTGSMTIKFHPSSDMGKWIVNGSLDPILGGWMSQNDTISVTVPASTEEGTYHIHFSVLALVYVNGIVDQSNPPTFDSWWLIDKKGNISKYDNSTSVSFGPSPHSVEIKDKSPLQQLKSGIAANDVKCSQDLHLILKAEDGSPACVNSYTALRLAQIGWTKFESAQSNEASNAKTNPFGIVGLMYYYGGGSCGIRACPLNTFNLKMNSNYTAYLLGYNICDDNSCIMRNDLSTLLPLNVIGTPNYKFIALPENPQWKYGDVFHIQVEVSSIPDNKTAIWTDLGNSIIVP